MSSHSLRADTISSGEFYRGILFCGSMLIFWITLEPLKDYSTQVLYGTVEGSDVWNQIVYLSLFALALATLGHLGWRRFAPMLHPAWGLTLAWFALGAVVSVNAGLSVRRLVLTVMVMVIVAVLLLLPRDRRQFETWLGGVALAVMTLCYLAIIAVPHLAIHQADAATELNLAGSWRGIYIHKSLAGPMMIIFSIIGVHLIGQKRIGLGLPLFVGSVLFLAFTGAKQAQALILFVYVWTWLASRIRSTTSLVLFCLAPLAVYLTLTVGSVMVPAAAAFNKAVMSDPTFTNRTGIWAFALEHAAQKPFFGWGFSAFWNTGLVRYGDATGQDAWKANASDSHNSYLDLALTTGVPGLAFAAIVLLVLPILDFARAKRIEANRALALMFFRIWLFGAFQGSMETLFFQRGSAFWVTLLVAILGLRYMAVFPVKAESASRHA